MSRSQINTSERFTFSDVTSSIRSFHCQSRASISYSIIVHFISFPTNLILTITMTPPYTADSANRTTGVVNSVRLMKVAILCPYLVFGFALQNPATITRRMTTSADQSMICRAVPRAAVPSAPPLAASRRDAISAFSLGALYTMAMVGSSPAPAMAVPDCFQDCMKNCKKVAPNDPEYCLSNCKEYCEQDDRTDGLSGSVSAESGEVGLLGGTFGQGTVPKGEDRVSVI